MTNLEMTPENIILHLNILRSTLTFVIARPFLRLRQHRIAIRTGERDIHRAVDLDGRIAPKPHLEGLLRALRLGAGVRRRDGQPDYCLPFVLPEHELERGETGDYYADAGFDCAPI